MIREIKEETGLTISNFEFCGIKNWDEQDGARYMVLLYKNKCFFRNNPSIKRRWCLLDASWRIKTKRYSMIFTENAWDILWE